MSSPIRMTGLNSGLDTESIIQELVKVQSTKKESLEKAKTKLTWKQEIWTEMNSKIKTFYNKTLDTLRFTGSYKKKKTTIDDSKIASVVSSDKAVNGTQTLAVKQLAKSAYMTGGKLSNDGSVKETTTLNELTGGLVAKDSEVEYDFTSGGKTTTITLNGESTVKDVISKLQECGVNANFDETNQRIFVSAQNSGSDGEFSFEAKNANSELALAGLGLISSENIAGMTSASNEKAALYDTDEATTRASAGFQAYAKELALDKVDEIVARLKDFNDNFTDPTSEDYSVEVLNSYLGDAKALEQYYGAEIPTEVADLISTVKTNALATGKVDDAAIDAVTPSMDIAAVAEDKAFEEVNNAKKSVDNFTNLATSRAAKKIDGQNAKILLNGVEYSSSTNAVTVNGLTINVQSESEKKDDGTYVETFLNTQDDVDGIYDMIKNFFKEYNTLINEMDSKYNADKAKGYEPLTDDEKDAMSDEEVEKWETKIKDALLRRDDSLSTVINCFKTDMMASITIDGKSYSLANFGIETLNYFTAADNERGAYHIDGDEDDENTSSNTDKLKTMISTNPDLVTEFFSQLTSNLYKDLDKIMSRTDYRSKYSVYDDKAMKTDLSDYDTKIKEQEDYISKLEDRYYSQFTAMEKAMANLNSQQSALSGILG